MQSRILNILVVIPGLIPSVSIGILRPLISLEKSGIVKIRLRPSNIKLGLEYDTSWCDIAVFCRNCELTDLEVLYRLKSKGKKIIYDIDDNFFEIPINLPIGRYHRSFHRLYVVKRFYELADIVRVYTLPMFHQASLYGQNVNLVKSYFDSSLLEGITPLEPKKIKIAYPTNRIDDPKLESMLFEIIEKTALHFSEKVEIHLWRSNLPERIQSLPNIYVNTPSHSYEDFIQQFYKSGFSIGLAPLIDGVFFQSKTNNKYREFGGCKIAGIYSNLSPYTECVHNNTNGLLVENSVNAWIAAIKKLVNDVELRKEIVFNAHHDITQNYLFDQNVKVWENTINKLAISLTQQPIYKETRCISSTPFIIPSKKIFRNAKKQIQTITKETKWEFIKFNSISEYIKGSFSLQNSPLLFCLCDSIEHLHQIIDTQPVSDFIVIDISIINDIEKHIIKAISKLSLSSNFIFIVKEEQIELTSFFHLNHYSYYTILPSHDLYDFFTVRSRMGVYLELIDKFGRSYTKKKSKAYLNYLKLAHKPYYFAVHALNRFKRALIFLKWRIGYRKV